MAAGPNRRRLAHLAVDIEVRQQIGSDWEMLSLLYGFHRRASPGRAADQIIIRSEYTAYPLRYLKSCVTDVYDAYSRIELGASIICVLRLVQNVMNG